MNDLPLRQRRPPRPFDLQRCQALSEQAPDWSRWLAENLSRPEAHFWLEAMTRSSRGLRAGYDGRPTYQQAEQALSRCVNSLPPQILLPLGVLFPAPQVVDLLCGLDCDRATAERLARGAEEHFLPFVERRQELSQHFGARWGDQTGLVIRRLAKWLGNWVPPRDFAGIYRALCEGGQRALAGILEDLADDPDWGPFWQCHRGQLQDSLEVGGTFLSRAESYGGDSAITITCRQWLQEQRPVGNWLRLSGCPQQPPSPPPPRLRHSGGVVLSLKVTADGHRAISGGQDHVLRHWDLAGSELLGKVDLEGPVWAVALSGEARLAASACAEGILQIWDLETYSLRGRLDHDHSVLDLALTPDGRLLIFVGGDGLVWAWDWQSGLRRSSGKGSHEPALTCLALEPPGRVVVTGRRDGSLRVWDAGSLTCLRELRGHTDSVSALAFTPDGDRLVSKGCDGSLRLWDLESADCLSVWEVDSPQVGGALAISPDGRRVAVAGGRGVRVLDLNSGEVLTTLEEEPSGGTALAFTPDGRRLLCGRAPAVHVWSLDGAPQEFPHQRQARLGGHRGRVASVRFTPDGARVISGGQDGLLRIWEFESGVCQRRLLGHQADVTSVRLSLDGCWAVTGSSDASARVWDLETGACSVTYTGHSQRTFVRGITTDCALTVSWDGSMHLWDLRTGAIRLRHDQAQGPYFAQADRVLQLSQAQGAGGVVLDIGGAEVGAFPGELACLTILDSPEGPRAVSGLGPLQLWDLERCELIATLQATRSRETEQVAMAGEYLVCASQACRFCVYRWDTGELVAQWPTDEPIHCVAAHPSGRFAVGLGDGQLHLLQLQPAK